MILNERQLATAAWLLIFITYVLWKPERRELAARLLQTATHRLILLPVLLTSTYIWGLTLVLADVGLWDGSHVIKTWLWIFTAGVVSIFHIAQADNPMAFLKSAIAKNFKIAIVLTFFVNLYAMPLWLEFLFLPFTVFVVALQVIADTKSKQNQEYGAVKKIATNTLAAYGLGVFGFAAYSAYQDFNSFASWETLKKFLVPIELSLLSVPLLYYFSVLSIYEKLFIRLQFFTKDDLHLRGFLKWMVFLHCNVHLRRLWLWLRLLPGLDLSSTNAVLSSFQFNKKLHSVDPPSTFRGLEWGSAPASYMRKVIETEAGISLYTQDVGWPVFPLFGCKVDEECYHYENDRLYGIDVFLDGRDAFDEGRYEFQALYGPASFVNERGDLFRWKWPDKKFEICLWYESRHDRVTASMTNDGEPQQIGRC